MIVTVGPSGSGRPCSRKETAMAARIRFDGAWYDIPTDRLDTVTNALTGIRSGENRIIVLPRQGGYAHLLLTPHSSIILESDTMIEFPTTASP